MSDQNFDQEDIVYRVVDGGSLLGRLYRPRGQRCTVLVVDVHGGGWVNGDRLNNAAINEALANVGVAVFALDFRMPPVACFPVALEDVNYGIRWVRKNAKRLGLSPTLVGGIGTSSGGHLLLTNSLKPDHFSVYDLDLEKVASNLDFVIACWPVADPLARYQMAMKQGIQNLIDAHHAFWPNEATMAIANPQRILEGNDALKLPPLLLLQGTSDENVQHQGADQFAESYRSRGGHAELFKYEAAPHAFITRDPHSTASRAALLKIIQFIEMQVARKQLGATNIPCD